MVLIITSMTSMPGRDLQDTPRLPDTLHSHVDVCDCV